MGTQSNINTEHGHERSTVIMSTTALYVETREYGSQSLLSFFFDPSELFNLCCEKEGTTANLSLRAGQGFQFWLVNLLLVL